MRKTVEMGQKKKTKQKKKKTIGKKKRKLDR